MIGNPGVLVCFTIKPDFVASGGLAVELKTARFQLPHDFRVSKAREPAH